MSNARNHMFIATASSVALSLTALVAASAGAQDGGSPAVTASEPSAAAGPGIPASSVTPLTARVIDVSGKARWRASPDAEWKDASVNDDLSPGAEVRTGMRSRVALRFRNATVLVDSSTNFAIPTIEQEGDVLRTIAAVRSGRADFKVDKVGLQNDFKVVTPSSTLAVRGTSFATITGPLKGVEIVGSRDNGIRAIELRYAALNQTVEMSGGSESKSTSETPNPTENALGSTFNAPQSGMVASKEEAQQGALAGSSAPQTQRQSTTTVAAVTQVKQDIQAAEQGESGNSTISLLIDIARAASLRADAERHVRAMIGTPEEPGPLVLARDAAVQAHQAYGEASAAAAAYDEEVARATGKVNAALEALRDAGEWAASSIAARDGVRSAGDDAFGAFIAGGSEASVRDHVAAARVESGQSSSHAAQVDASLRDADGLLAHASEIGDLIRRLADEFTDANARLAGNAAAIGERALQVEELRALVDSANAAVQGLAAGKSVPQITQSAILAAQAALDALSRATEAGALRSDAMAKAGEMFLRAQHVLRDAVQAEIAAAGQAAADAGQLRIDADSAAAHAQDSLAKIDDAIEGMLQARSGQEEASAARIAAEEFSVLAAARQANAAIEVGIARASQLLVSGEHATVLRELGLANASLARCEIHGEATSAYAQHALNLLSQTVPDVAGASEAAQLAGGSAEFAVDEAALATIAAGAADLAAGRAEAEVLDPAFTASESEWIRLVDGQDADDEVAAIGTSALDARLAADRADDGSSRADLSGVSGWGGSAAAAVSAAAELAEQANQQALAADDAFMAAQAALAQSRSSAERMVWSAVRDLAEAARLEANRALEAAATARAIAGRALGEANAAGEAVGAFGSAAVASSSQQGASAAHDAAAAVSAQVVALVQANQSVLAAHSQSIAQSLQALGGTLAVTDVAQGSVSQVASILSSVNGQFLSFMTSADGVGGVTDSQVDSMLGILLEERNRALAAALAGGIGAADSATSIAEYLASIAGDSAEDAQARTDAIGAILHHTASVLGVATDDPRLALIGSLAHGAAGWSSQASASALAAGGAATDADAARDLARNALYPIGSAPEWGAVDLAALFGADAASAANAAAQSASDAASAALGASALVAFEGAAQATRMSVDASDAGVVDAGLLLQRAHDAASAATSAAASIGSNGEARLGALAAIADARGGIESVRDGAASSLGQASGGLDDLIESLGSGQASRASALSTLAAVHDANESAQVAGEQMRQLLAGLGSSRDAFESVLESLGASVSGARQALEQAEQSHMPDARANEVQAQAFSDALAPHVAQLLAASESGNGSALDAELDRLYVAALWLQQRALAELDRLQQSIADAESARSDADSAAAGYEVAAEEAAAAVLASAQSAAALATEFLDQVDALRREHAIGIRVADALGAREAANAAGAALAGRSLLVAQAVDDVMRAIGQHEAAVGAMSAAVLAAQDARTEAVESLVQLQGTFDFSDAALASLWSALLEGDRSSANAQSLALADASVVALEAAGSADEARAAALDSLAGLGGGLGQSSDALAALDSLQGDLHDHQLALDQQESQIDGAIETADRVESEVGALVLAAGTERGEVLGDHASDIAGDAIERANEALESIAGLRSDLNQAHLAAQGVDSDRVNELQFEADEIRQWAMDLELPSGSAAQREAARVAAMAGIGASAIGAFDAHAEANSGRIAAEAARDVASAERDKVFQQVSVHEEALHGVGIEHGIALQRRNEAEQEFGVARFHNGWAGYWRDQTLLLVDQQDFTFAGLGAGLAGASANLAEEASDRADGAATLAEDARDRADIWTVVAAGAESIVSSALALADSSSDSAHLQATNVVTAAAAAGDFADAAAQLAEIADTLAAGDVSEFARRMHDQSVEQAVLAEAARDAALDAAASARNHAQRIVFGAVAAKAAETATFAQQARSFAQQASMEAESARSRADEARIAAETGQGGGTR